MSNHTEAKLDTIECPKCRHAIPITEALRHKLTEELNEKIQQREALLKQRENALATQETQVHERIEKEVAEATAERESALKTRESAVAMAGKEIDKKIEQGLQKERAQIEADARRKAEDALSLEMKDTKAQLDETREKLSKAEKAELGLRKRERELEEKERNADLEVERKLNAQKAEVEENVGKKFAEEYRFKELEKEKVIKDLQRALEDANRKAQQGSQQLQGEVQELDLESLLAENFPMDEIKPVPKGVAGADVLQIVRTRSGTVCGAILWESKRTKHWSESWISKLKDDQRDARADIAVIVSSILPKDLDASGHRERVWITDYSSFLMLGAALRSGLLELASSRLAAANKGEIGDMLMRYVTGPEFRHKVEAMIDTFRDMKEGIEKEKRSSVARWAKQEKQIDKLVMITAGAYGDLQGLVGPSMQSIPALESGDDETASPAIALSVAEEPDLDDGIEPEEIPF